MDMKPTNNSQA